MSVQYFMVIHDMRARLFHFGEKWRSELTCAAVSRALPLACLKTAAACPRCIIESASKIIKVKNKTHTDYPFWQIPRLWGILPDRLCYFVFFRIAGFQPCRAVGVASAPLCVVIPHLWKHSSLPWAHVSPGVPESTTAAAKQLSAAVESHPTRLLASIFT